ncbi:hypothetical protein ACJVC5_19845 [Peredibacter sp. HCB2-198]|uniref:hypothetical protein n=1 Tax=Peredibacter sp. HCB2-198 TaxID=3383025 RepID=UPI0038B5EDF9
MLQFIVAAILSTFIISNAWSKCLDSNARNNNLWRPDFSTSDLGTINIPLKINGQQACYHQNSALFVKGVGVDETSAEFEISPLAAEFENVPEPETYQYLNIEYSEDGLASKINIVSFLCSGENPIGADAFSGSLKTLLELNDEENTGPVSIANGQAADNLTVNQEKKIKAKVYFHFVKLFESRNPGVSIEDMKDSNIFVPNVMALNKLYSTFFGRTNSSLNGCSSAFREKMQDLLIENIISTQSFKDIEIRKKLFSSKFRMKWKI